MEMRSLVNTDSEFRAGERRPRSVVRALRSMRASDRDHVCVLHLLVTLPPAVIYVTHPRSLRAAERGTGEFHVLANHLPGRRHLPSLLLPAALAGDEQASAPGSKSATSARLYHLGGLGDGAGGQGRQSLETGRQFKISNHGPEETVVAIKEVQE